MMSNANEQNTVSAGKKARFLTLQKLMMIVCIFSISSVELLITPSEVLAATEASDKSKDLLRMIAAGINSNYSQIQAFSAEFDMVFDRPWANRVQKKEQAKDGSISKSVSIEIVPHETVTGVIYGCGSSLRWEGGEPKTILVFADDLFTQYLPNGKIAWRRRPNEMVPLSIPWDPRNIGGLDDNRKLTQILNEDQLVETAFQLGDNKERIARVIVKNKKGKRVSFEFDPSKSMLPKRSILYCSDGSINQVLDIVYQKVPSTNPVWFLQKVNCRTYSRGVAHTSKAEGWNQIETLNIKELKLIKERDVAEGLFELQFPKGTIIHDNIEKKTRRIGGEDARENGFSGNRRYTGIRIAGFIIATGACLVLVLMRFQRRSGRNRPV